MWLKEDGGSSSCLLIADERDALCFDVEEGHDTREYSRYWRPVMARLRAGR